MVSRNRRLGTSVCPTDLGIKRQSFWDLWKPAKPKGHFRSIHRGQGANLSSAHDLTGSKFQASIGEPFFCTQKKGETGLHAFRGNPSPPPKKRKKQRKTGLKALVKNLKATHLALLAHPASHVGLQRLAQRGGGLCRGSLRRQHRQALESGASIRVAVGSESDGNTRNPKNPSMGPNLFRKPPEPGGKQIRSLERTRIIGMSSSFAG